jgi:hypothetical protein
MFARRWLVLVAGLALAGAALAGEDTNRKTYKCKNEKGEVYFSDHFVPEQCKGGGAQLNNQGVTVRTIERQMTPEEIAAAKEKAAREAEEKRIADKQAAADRVLLQSYANEDELTRAHQKELTQIDTEIQAARVALQAQEKSLTELLNMAADAERTGQKVSAQVNKNIGIVRRQVESQKTFITRKQAQKEDLERVYQGQLKRYRELASDKVTGKPATPSAN